MTKGTDIKKIKTNLVGEYNLPNVLAAVALGKYFSVKEEAIQNAIEHYLPSNSRSQLIEKDGNEIILDAYNANPSSMKAAIENFASMQGDHKILLLGAMMELGNESIAEHRSIVSLIDQHRWKAVVLVGGDFNKIIHEYLFFQKAEEAKEWLQKQAYQGVKLLIKGSRSIEMEKILE
jgi:UDP-N-acetylmuramoyl-tripeptide--D-alanyl-D-alanine ligase